MIQFRNSKEKNYKFNGKPVILVLLVALFFLSLLCFHFYMKPIFFVQENKSLFVFTTDYFLTFITNPGGLLVYAGNFLKQIYFNPFISALLLSVIILIQTFVFIKIAWKISNKKKYGFTTALACACLFIILHTTYNFYIYQSIGLLLVTSLFLFTVNVGIQKKHLIIFLIYPVLYFISGTYAWLFVAMFSIYHIVFVKGKLRYVFPLFMLGIATMFFLLSRRYLFLQPLEKLFVYPMFNGSVSDENPVLIALYLFVGFYPLIIKINVPEETLRNKRALIQVFIVLILFGATYLVVNKTYNRQVAYFYQIESYVYNHNWKAVIEMYENNPSKNLSGQFYYNLALNEEGLLCDRLFETHQAFGEKALVLPRELKSEIINRGLYFYYSIGLINEAHHWAYESMVSDGYRPENLKMLVKTNIINGNYRIARKYLDILKQTWRYREWAVNQETLILDPSFVRNDIEFNEKLSLVPETNFFVDSRDPFKTLNHLAYSEDNKKAFEYVLARALLLKDVETVVENIHKMKQMGYSRIPRHIEEAVYVYRNLTKGRMPNLGGLKLNRVTELRYKQYLHDFRKYRSDKELAQKKLYAEWGNTFWYYMHFVEINKQIKTK